MHWKPITELRSITCHMGSHSVTCHPTQVNMRRLNPSHAGRYLIYLPQWDGRLSWPCLTDRLWFKFPCWAEPRRRSYMTYRILSAVSHFTHQWSGDCFTFHALGAVSVSHFTHQWSGDCFTFHALGAVSVSHFTHQWSGDCFKFHALCAVSVSHFAHQWSGDYFTFYALGVGVSHFTHHELVDFQLGS